MELPSRQVELCKNLLFLDFHCPKVHVNMFFISSKYVEQTNHNFYDEAGMNEICSIYSQMLMCLKPPPLQHTVITNTRGWSVKAFARTEHQRGSNGPH